MFLDTMTAINHHSDKCTIHKNTIDNGLNLIMRISVVPHQLGIATIGLEGSWVKFTPTPTKIDNHKHNILSPLVTNVKIISRRRGLKRVHYKGTFSVSSHNNKCKYALCWYSLI